jgi:hypothetical protein
MAKSAATSASVAAGIQRTRSGNRSSRKKRVPKTAVCAKPVIKSV